jgi:hypothetical protein
VTEGDIPATEKAHLVLNLQAVAEVTLSLSTNILLTKTFETLLSSRNNYWTKIA